MRCEERPGNSARGMALGRIRAALHQGDPALRLPPRVRSFGISDRISTLCIRIANHALASNSDVESHEKNGRGGQNALAPCEKAHKLPHRVRLQRQRRRHAHSNSPALRGGFYGRAAFVALDPLSRKRRLSGGDSLFARPAFRFAVGAGVDAASVSHQAPHRSAGSLACDTPIGGFPAARALRRVACTYADRRSDRPHRGLSRRRSVAALHGPWFLLPRAHGAMGAAGSYLARTPRRAPGRLYLHPKRRGPPDGDRRKNRDARSDRDHRQRRGPAAFFALLGRGIRAPSLHARAGNRSG